MNTISVSGVPVEEVLAVEQAGELLADTLGHLLGGGGVAEVGDGYPEALGGASFGGPDVEGDHSTK